MRTRPCSVNSTPQIKVSELGRSLGIKSAVRISSVGGDDGGEIWKNDFLREPIALFAKVSTRDQNERAALSF